MLEVLNCKNSLIMSGRRVRKDRKKVICKHHCKVSKYDQDLKLIQFRLLPDHYKIYHKIVYDRNNVPFYLPSDPYGILHYGMSALSAPIKREPTKKKRKLDPTTTSGHSLLSVDESKSGINTSTAPSLS